MKRSTSVSKAPRQKPVLRLPKQTPVVNPKAPTEAEINKRKAYIEKHEEKRHVCQVCQKKFLRATAPRATTCKAPLYRNEIRCQLYERYITSKNFPTHRCIASAGSVVNSDELDWTRHDQRDLSIPESEAIPGRAYSRYNCGQHFACANSSIYHERYHCKKGPQE